MSATFRPPGDEDAVAVAELMSEHSPDGVDPEAVRRDWTSPVIDREHDVRIDTDAYALVEDMTEGRVWLELHGRPSAGLLDWAEARGREKGSRFLSGAWSSDETILDLLARRGFGVVRHAHRMEIDLGSALAPATWPDDVTVRTYEPGDERTFYELHQEVFEDTWEPIRETYEEWAHWLFDGPDFVPDLWFLASSSDGPAGFALCHPYLTRPELGWVRVLGVRRDWRRRGLGRALLLHAFDAFSKRGLRHAGLGVDATSLTGANRLYEQVGMRVTARFDIYEKVLT
jgi:ribosomal protein S18 acetylase RimI-like enzyme